MKQTLWGWSSRHKSYFRIILVWIAILLFGCQAPAPPLSPGAAAFKTEVGRCLTGLAAALAEPVFKKDITAINAVLRESESGAVKLCRMCPFRIAVLDQYGSTLAVHPPRNKTSNFSSYSLVTKTIKTGKIQHQSLFLQDGSQIYMVSAPFIRNHKAVGLIAILVSAEEAAKRFGLTDQEFKTLDFNA